MSGTSNSTPCPICGKEMDTYNDWKPMDNVSGNCIYCGFAYYTRIEQMDLDEINERRADYNENNNHLPKNELLKPLKKKDLDWYKDEIKKFW